MSVNFERGRRSDWPWATTIVLGTTALLTAAQIRYPGLLSALERQPGELARHQYWRLFTPLFVHSDGWKQIAFNFPVIAVAGIFAERIYGVRTWLLCYFVPGVAANLIATWWQPSGAGASVAGAGLLGALALHVILRARAAQARFGAVLILLGGAALAGFRDIHGPPILLGAAIALVATRDARSGSGQAG